MLGFILALPFALIGVTAEAVERGTTEEAKALVVKAVAALDAKGDAALAEISDPAGPLVDRDLYVIVFDPNGEIKAHGANKRLIGKNLWKAKDPDGVPFVQVFFETIKKTPTGDWVNFKFTHPKTKKIEKKVMWVVEHKGRAVMAGAYPQP